MAGLEHIRLLVCLGDTKKVPDPIEWQQWTERPFPFAQSGDVVASVHAAYKHLFLLTRSGLLFAYGSNDGGETHGRGER